MNMLHKQFTTSAAIKWSLGVFVVCLLGGTFLWYCVQPISSDNQSARTALSLFAAVLGILAGGCTKAFFAFTYKNVEDKEKVSVYMMSWSLIAGVFLLVFLCFYCMRKTGVFAFMDSWALWAVLVATFCMLNGLVLLDRWDATWPPTEESEDDDES